MNINYSFLQDELALVEIRKHKWIESEKSGKEISFATAALDWIKKYGQDWKNYRFGLQSNQNIFSEKRHYRRFSYQWPIQLKINDHHIVSQTHDINLIGLSCDVPSFVAQDTSAEVVVSLHAQGNAKKESKLQFQSKVKKIAKQKGKSFNKVFVPFTEEIRNYLRANAGLLAA